MHVFMVNKLKDYKSIRIKKVFRYFFDELTG